MLECELQEGEGRNGSKEEMASGADNREDARDEFLNAGVFDTSLETRVLCARWRREYDRQGPHSAWGYRPPAPEAVEPLQLQVATVW